MVLAYLNKISVERKNSQISIYHHMSSCWQNLSPSYQCLVHTTLQLKTTGTHNTCIISIISPHNYSSLKITLSAKQTCKDQQGHHFSYSGWFVFLIRSFCYMYMYMSCHVMAVVKFRVGG